MRTRSSASWHVILLTPNHFRIKAVQEHRAPCVIAFLHGKYAPRLIAMETMVSGLLFFEGLVGGPLLIDCLLRGVVIYLYVDNDFHRNDLWSRPLFRCQLPVVELAHLTFVEI